MAKTINLGKVGLTFGGDYDSSKDYASRTCVFYNHVSWASKKDVPAGIAPGTNDAYWQKVSERGAQGMQGERGPQGNSAFDGTGIELVNNLTEGGEASALSAEQGKILKAELTELESKTLPLKEYGVVDGYIISGKWYLTKNTSIRKSAYISIVGGCDITIVTKNVASYAFVTKKSFNNEEEISFATGSSRTEIPINTTITITSPLDAQYLWVAIQQGVDDRTPSAIIIDGYDYIKGIYKDLSDKISETNKIFDSVVKSDGFLYDELDLNKVLNNSFYILNSSTTYSNVPMGGAAFLRVNLVDDYVLQEFYSYGGLRVFKRRGNINGSFEEWQEISSENIHKSVKISLPSCDLNTVGENYTYLMDDSHTYENAPYESAIGFLRTSTVDDYTLQEFYPFSGFKLYKRRGVVNGTWTDWGEVSGNGVVNNITNEYNYPSFTNTYNITATPVINADTNNYLASTNDNADRTADIIAMLEATGICKLGAGQFYVSNLEMFDNTTIQGCGSATRVVLSENATFAIKMAKQCCVQDLQLIGSLADIAPESIGERHGILWQGNYNETTSNAKQPQKGIISNLWISNFTGGGITCYNTGYGTMCHIEAVNLHIWNCGAGINISYWSEFHKFTNVRCQQCMYGCVNNGGNNIFVNCDFSSNGEGFLMDNSQGQSPNNSHGSAIGCVFNHTASNTGIGIKILGNENGFIFDACQIFYSQIYIKDSYGMAFTNCNFGKTNCEITIEGDGCTLLANNIFQTTPTITKNNMTRIVGCYTRNGVLIS